LCICTVAPITVLVSVRLFMPAVSVAQKVKIQTEDGVTVVRNPKKPVPQPGGPSKLLLKEDPVIGKEAGESGYLFAGIIKKNKPYVLISENEEDIPLVKRYVMEWK
jgi:hypothetical protein